MLLCFKVILIKYLSKILKTLKLKIKGFLLNLLLLRLFKQYKAKRFKSYSFKVLIAAFIALQH
jgi:hypothetical protein